MLARALEPKLRVPMLALTLLLSFGLVVGLAGCGGDADQPLVEEGEEETASEQNQQSQDQGSDETAQATDQQEPEASDTQESDTQEEEAPSDEEQDERADGTDMGEQEDEQAQSEGASEEQADDQQGDEASEDEVSLVERGQMVAQNNGCLGCHSPDGSQMVGPTWKDAYGTDVALESGETVAYDEDYVRNSIRNPNDQIHEGYPANVMQPYDESQISEEQLQALIAYIKSLSESTSEDDGDN